jgi:tetratricopeptide (TPR) repeat protein
MALALIVCTVAAGPGCRRSDDGATASRDVQDAPRANVESLRPVAPPQLAGAEDGLQDRIRARFDALEVLRSSSTAEPAELAAAYGEVGKLLLGAEFFEAAEPYLLNAQTLAPRDLAWPYYLAHLYRLQNRFDSAIAAFDRALANEPGYVPALVWLGAMHVDAGRFAEGEPPLQKAVTLQPQSIAARFWLGRAALGAGDAKRAAEHLEAALSIDSDVAAVRYPLAMAYRRLGDPQRAELHLSRWKEGRVEPDDPLMGEIGASLQTAVSYEVQGTQALEQGKWREAAGMFRKGIEVAPRDATLRQNLGTALFLGGNAAAAQAEFEEAIRLWPRYAKAHFSLGVLLDAGGREAEAIRHYREAVSHDANMTTAQLSLADALRRSGEVEPALAHYEAILKIDSAASQARFGRAMALVRLGRYREARTLLEEAAARHPEQPGFIHALARVLAAAPDEGVRDGARAWSIVQSLEQQFGTNAALTETAAMALAETGRLSEAVARQRKAIDEARSENRAGILPVLLGNLRRYEAGMPCREPWSPDDPVHRPPPPAPPG